VLAFRQVATHSQIAKATSPTSKSSKARCDLTDQSTKETFSKERTWTVHNYSYKIQTSNNYSRILNWKQNLKWKTWTAAISYQTIELNSRDTNTIALFASAIST